MGRSDFEIRRIFSEEEVLPEVVRIKKHEAYDTIFDQVKAQETRKEENAQSEGATKRKGKMSLHRLGTLPKVAGFLIACVLVFGGTAVATTLLLNRYDRMKQMEQKEKDTLWGDLEQGGNLAYELSRQLTARESDRLNKLREKYKSNEALPDGELLKRFFASETADSIAVNILLTSLSEYSYVNLFEQFPKRRTMEIILIVRDSAIRTNFSRLVSLTFFICLKTSFCFTTPHIIS